MTENNRIVGQTQNNPASIPSIENYLANRTDQLSIASGGNTQTTLQRLNYDGTLDISFAQNGLLAINNLLGSETLLTAISLQVDGKILVTGVTWPSDNSVNNLDNSKGYVTNSDTSFNPFILRLLSDGAPDQSFGTNGVSQLNRGHFEDLISIIS